MAPQRKSSSKNEYQFDNQLAANEIEKFFICYRGDWAGLIKLSIERDDYGFEPIKLSEISIDKNSISKKQPLGNQESLCFRREASLSYMDISGITSRKRVNFGGDAVISHVDGRYFVSDIVITSLN